jgi:hypothetical protein
VVVIKNNPLTLREQILDRDRGSGTLQSSFWEASVHGKVLFGKFLR